MQNDSEKNHLKWFAKAEEDELSIRTRYPGDVPEFTMEECRAAFEAALIVKGFALKKVAA